MIENLNEKLFDNLKELKYVTLESNECVDAEFGCADAGKCLTSLSLLKTQLQLCSSNITRERDERKIKCWIQKDNIDYGPEYQNCEVLHVDLSSRNKTFTFIASEKEIRETTFVQFWQSLEANFIPSEVFQQFPSLNGLTITLSGISTVKNDLFSQDCEQIEYLDLSDNKIEKIESLAFQHLWKLKSIDLSGNLIKSLADQIFFYNYKLRVILFLDGFVEMITPRFFENLKKLEMIEFERNECINDSFISTNNNSSTNIEMPLCYSNCAADLECAAKAEEDTKFIKRILDCKVLTSESTSYWPEFKYCEVRKVDLTNNSFGTKFIFNVAQNESKKMISTVRFFFGGDVDFILSETVQQFSELNGLWIDRYKIPTLKNQLFPIQFKNLEYLDLSQNRIEIIEPFVFRFLTELKWLNLNWNSIKTLPNEILVNNLKLICISFYDNQIEKFIPGIISDSSPLKFVDFEQNSCVDKEFDCDLTECPLKFSRLNLSECYSNDEINRSSPNVTEIKLKCLYNKREYDFWPEHQFCEVMKANLSVKGQTFTFSGTKEEKETTSAVLFWNSPTINFITLEIFEQFPSLNGLDILGSTIPILKDDLFTIECQKNRIFTSYLQ